MKLTGKQVKQIHTAILDGYNPESLRRLVRVDLEENLHNISSGGNFSDQVFTLIEWAERQGRLVELVRAAHEQTPNNTTLQSLWRDLQTWFALSTPAPPASSPSTGELPEPAPPAPRSQPPSAQLFLSYSRHDTLTMRRLRIAIEGAGMTVWTDDGLEPGTPRWQTAIENAIRQTQALLVILSPAAKASEWVNIEVSFALRLQRRVFPVLVEGDDTDAVPITLFNTQFVDGRNDLAGVVTAKLLPALCSYLGVKFKGTKAQNTSNLSETTHQSEVTLPDALINLLATLYPDKSSIRRVLDAIKVDIDPLVNDWHAILKGVIAKGKLTNLFMYAVSGYEVNRRLRAVLAVSPPQPQTLELWKAVQSGELDLDDLTSHELGNLISFIEENEAISNTDAPPIPSLSNKVEQPRVSGGDNLTEREPSSGIDTTLLSELRKIFADLYEDQSRSRIIVHDAGLDAAKITFSGQASVTWHSILQEAGKTDKLPGLLTIALRDYGGNKQLQQVAAALRGAKVDVLEETTRIRQDEPHQQSGKLPASQITRNEFIPTVDPIAALVVIMQDASFLPSKTRLEAGLKAADLGALPPDLDDLVLMPAKAQLGYDFRIGKYPVTNHQFRRFVEAGGYTDDRWWPDKEGRDYRNKAKWRQPRYWDDDKFNHTTQPVVGVSWYEAVAYCAWLTAQWQPAGRISQTERVQLPTEVEWVFAARSGQPEPKDKTTDYPWQGPFDFAFANTKESELAQTTPVHMYPRGCTPLGVWDMSGNVWEWTREQSSSGYYMKGGSFSWDAARATRSARDWDARWLRYVNFGFRVVVAPISR